MARRILAGTYLLDSILQNLGNIQDQWARDLSNLLSESQQRFADLQNAITSNAPQQNVQDIEQQLDNIIGAINNILNQQGVRTALSNVQFIGRPGVARGGSYFRLFDLIEQWTNLLNDFRLQYRDAQSAINTFATQLLNVFAVAESVNDANLNLIHQIADAGVQIDRLFATLILSGDSAELSRLFANLQATTGLSGDQLARLLGSVNQLARSFTLLFYESEDNVLNVFKQSLRNLFAGNTLINGSYDQIVNAINNIQDAQIVEISRLLKRYYGSQYLLDINDFIARAERPSRANIIDMQNVLLPVADLLTTTIGMKTKALTGISVDAVLNIVKSPVQFAMYQVATRAQGYLLNTLATYLFAINLGEFLTTGEIPRVLGLTDEQVNIIRQNIDFLRNGAPDRQSPYIAARQLFIRLLTLSYELTGSLVQEDVLNIIDQILEPEHIFKYFDVAGAIDETVIMKLFSNLGLTDLNVVSSIIHALNQQRNRLINYLQMAGGQAAFSMPGPLKVMSILTGLQDFDKLMQKQTIAPKQLPFTIVPIKGQINKLVEEQLKKLYPDDKLQYYRALDSISRVLNESIYEVLFYQLSSGGTMSLMQKLFTLGFLDSIRGQDIGAGLYTEILNRTEQYTEVATQTGTVRVRTLIPTLLLTNLGVLRSLYMFAPTDLQGNDAYLQLFPGVSNVPYRQPLRVGAVFDLIAQDIANFTGNDRNFLTLILNEQIINLLSGTDTLTYIDRAYLKIRSKLYKRIRATPSLAERLQLLQLLSDIESLFYDSGQNLVSVRRYVLNVASDLYNFMRSELRRAGAIQDADHLLVLNALFGDQDLFTNPLLMASLISMLWQKFARESAIEGFNVMATDVQKTVDKTNDKVIILLLQSSLLGGNREIDPTLGAALLYTLIARGDIAQFNQQAIYQALVEALNRNDLQQFGFTNEFIQRLRTVQPNQLLQNLIRLEDMRLQQPTNIRLLINFLYSSMYTPIADLLSDENILPTVKQALLYSQISRFINVGQTLGLGREGDLLIRRLIVGELVRDLFAEELGLRLTSDIPLSKKSVNKYIDELTYNMISKFKLLLPAVLAARYNYQVGNKLIQDIAHKFFVGESLLLIDTLKGILGISDKDYERLLNKLKLSALASAVAEAQNMTYETASDETKSFLKREGRLMQRANKLRRQGKTKQARKLVAKARRIKTDVSGTVRYYRQQLMTDPYSYVELHRKLLVILLTEKADKLNILKLTNFFEHVDEAIIRIIGEDQFAELNKRGFFIRSLFGQTVTSTGGLTTATSVLLKTSGVDAQYLGAPSIRLLDNSGFISPVQYAKRHYFSDRSVIRYVSLIESEPDMLQYQAVRDPRKDFSTLTLHSLLTTGYLKKIRTSILQGTFQAGMYTTDIFPKEYLFMLAGSQRDDILDATLEQYKRELLEEIEDIIQSGSSYNLQSLADELDSSEVEDWEEKVKYMIKTYYTGLIESFGETTPGGLIVMLGDETGYALSTLRLQYVLRTIFESPDNLMSSLKLKLGQFAYQFNEQMYQPSELIGNIMPIGYYTSSSSPVKELVHKEVMRQFIVRLRQLLTRSTLSLEDIDIMRLLFMSWDRLQEVDRQLYETLLNLLPQERVTSYIDLLLRGQLFGPNNLQISSYDDIRLHFADILRHIYDSSRLPDQMSFDEAMARLRQAVTTIYASTLGGTQLNDRAMRSYFNLPSNMLLIHRFRYKDVLLLLLPHQLVDAISVSSPNTIGSVLGLRGYGHLSTLMQEMLNPFQQLTLSERVGNTYIMTAAPVTFLRDLQAALSGNRLFLDKVEDFLLLQVPGSLQDIQQLTTDYANLFIQEYIGQVETIRNINREFSKFLVRYRLNRAGQAAEELQGMIIPTLVVEKENELFFQNILNTDLNLAGDLYMMSRLLKESLRLVQRSSYGGFEDVEIPELFKITGVARSKGMVTHQFMRPIMARVTINNKPVDIPIGLIMNTQGKRKNKTAEFGAGTLRALRYIFDQIGGVPDEFRQLLDELDRGIDVTDVEAMEQLRKQLFNVFFSEEKGLMADVLIFDPRTKRYVETGYKMPLIFHKLLFYMGKSAEPEWLPISNFASQVMPQFLMNFSTLLKLLIVSADITDMQAVASILSQNIRLAGSESLALLQIKEWYDKNYISGTRMRQRALGYRLNAKVRKELLFDELLLYANVFNVQPSGMKSNQQRLLEMADLYTRLSRYVPEFLATARALNILASISANQRVTTPFGTTVLQLTEEQLRQLLELAGERLYLPAPMLSVFRYITRGRINIGRSPWSTEKTVLTMIHNALEYGGLRYFDVGQQRKLLFYEFIMPQLVEADFGQLYLSFDIESLNNLILGLQTLMQLLLRRDEKQLSRLLDFYYKRILSTGNQLYGRLLNLLLKKHGISIYGLHATLSSKQPGVRLPKASWLRLTLQLLKYLNITDAQSISNVLLGHVRTLIEHIVGSRRLSNLLTDREQYSLRTGIERELNALLDIITNLRSTRLLERYAAELLEITTDNQTGRIIVYLSELLFRHTTLTQIKKLVYSQLPDFFDVNAGVPELEVVAREHRQHVRSIARRIVRSYAQFTFEERLRLLRMPLSSELTTVAYLGQELFTGLAEMPRIGNLLRASYLPTSILRLPQGVDRDMSIQLAALELYLQGFGEVWGLLQRQPIIGHMPNTRYIGFSEYNTIDVPQYVAEAIAGDDDGDAINLLPYIFLDSSLFRQQPNQVRDAILELSISGVYDQLIFERHYSKAVRDLQRFFDYEVATDFNATRADYTVQLYGIWLSNPRTATQVLMSMRQFRNVYHTRHSTSGYNMTQIFGDTNLTDVWSRLDSNKDVFGF